MGERKGVNKYYPPDWDPSKGSINQYVGQHPLRDRARKLGQGILIIRFEMPYNIWCGGCNNHIGMGVRYNAEKTKTGMYYSTPIYKFRMKCHLCNNHFEIQTDPKNHDYVILEGARRKEQRWDPKENEQIVTEDKAVQKKMATDAMFKLEHGSDDIQKGKKAISNLGSLEVRRDEWKDDYMLNKLARQKFRDEKKALKAEADSDSALLVKSSLDIPLQKEVEEDIKLAGLIKYRTLESYDEKQAQKRKEIESRPLFEMAGKVARVENKSPGVDKLDIIKKQLKTTRAGSYISPFDRTKVNTLSPSVNKESLGIRKKSLPKYTTKHESCTDRSEEGSESKNICCSGSEKESSVDNRLESCEMQEGSCSGQKSEKNVASEGLTCTSCGKKINSEEGRNVEQSILLTCKCDTILKGTSNSREHSTSLKISHEDCTTNEKEDSRKEDEEGECLSKTDTVGMNSSGICDKQAIEKTCLRLVCSYSDSDSDGSS